MTDVSSGYLTRGLPYRTPDELTGSETIPMDTQLSGGESPQQGAVTPGTLTGFAGPINLVAAAGSNSQANSTALAYGGTSIVTTVSSTHRGVRLPTAVTGVAVSVFNDATTTVRVYPGTGATIGASSTNTNTTIATRKGTLFVAKNTNHWLARAGA